MEAGLVDDATVGVCVVVADVVVPVINLIRDADAADGVVARAPMIQMLEWAVPEASPKPKPWRRWVDTALASPEDITPWQTAPAVPGAGYTVQPRSLVVLAQTDIARKVTWMHEIAQQVFLIRHGETSGVLAVSTRAERTFRSPIT